MPHHFCSWLILLLRELSMISILCPSRGRPDMARRMKESALTTANGEIEVLFYLNQDDPELKGYDGLRGLVMPEVTTAYAWNFLTAEANGDMFMLAGDDCIFKTQGWDDRFKEVVPDDGIYCVAPHDGREDNSFPHFAVGRKWVETLGYFVPPIFFHWYVDSWTTDLARRIDRLFYLPNVLVDHVKPGVRAEKDETFWRLRKEMWSLRDRDVWYRTERYREQDAELLRCACS